jgi:hypothetical protein
MLTWSLCQAIIVGQLDSSLHLVLAMFCDVVIFLGSAALISDAIKYKNKRKP